MNNLTQPLTLLTLLLIWGLPALAQETDTTTASAFNWVEMPDQNPLPPPTITDGFGQYPQLVDIDGDGDLDAFDGHYFFENSGTINQPVFEKPTEITQKFFGGEEFGISSFADMDNDSDLDAFVIQQKAVRYYENIGNSNVPVFEERTGTANPLVGAESSRIFNIVDFDNDGDLDIFLKGLSQSGNPIQYYENTGNSGSPVLEKRTNPLLGVDIYSTSWTGLTFADIDQDKDFDVFVTVFSHVNGLYYYENIGSADQPQFENRTDTATNPLNEITHLRSEVDRGETIDLVDIDNDNDLDVFRGQQSLPMMYYENTGNIQSPRSVERHIFEEPRTVDAGGFSTPSFVDIDNDGDQDAFIGNLQGSVYYYENLGNARSPQFAKRISTANPLHEVFLNAHSFPSFADIDGDGDWDAFIGASDDGYIHYYENIGSVSEPQFLAKPTENPLGDVLTKKTTNISASWVDIDHDGDMDVFIMTNEQPIRYFENQGSVSHPVFEEFSGRANPLNGVKILWADTTLSFNDMDRDGDWDAVLSDENRIHYYENTGGSQFPLFEQRTDQNNPFVKFKLEYGMTPSLVDIDNDGNLEVFVGSFEGTVNAYQNLSEAQNQIIFKASLDNPLPPFNAEVNQINFTDLDNDNDWDAFLNQINGKISYSENIGDINHMRFLDNTQSAHPLAQITQRLKAGFEFLEVTLVDLDQDEDLDAVIASRPNYWYYENVGGDANQPRFKESSTNPFQNINYYGRFHFVDIDNDGDLDGFVGSGFRYFENTGNAHSPIFEKRVATTNLLGENTVTMYSPSFVDIDHDGDWDVFLGSSRGIKYFENIGDINQLQFEERTETANPLVGIQVESPVPALVDLDFDGDSDVIMGQRDGSLSYYENTGSAAIPVFVERADHVLDWVDVGMMSRPYLVDFDQDGDWDVFVSEKWGNLEYYENTGNATHPVFQPNTNNPLHEVNTPFWPYAHFVDIDNDTDQDVFVGDESGGQVIFYENRGDVNHPKFVERAETFTTLVGGVPTFVDIDNDQDWDAFIMLPWESIRYYENVGRVDEPSFVERVESANPLGQAVGGFDFQFMDSDSDGDWDMFILGEDDNYTPEIWHYENIGQVDNPIFIENDTANPISIILPPWPYHLSFVDSDGDGDLDVFVSGESGESTYYVNTSAKGHILADRYALPTGGKYNQGREVNLGCLDCTKIYYTLDGSQPTTRSPVFTAPFNLTETTTLKFFTVDGQGNASFVTTEQYLIDTQPPKLTITWPVNNQVLLEIGRIEGTVEEPQGGSELDRIELQISNKPLYLSGDDDDPFTRAPIWVKLPLTSRHQWHYDFGNLQLPIGPYEITARAYDQAGNFAEDTITVMKVKQESSDLFLELDSATLLNDATLNAKGSLISKRFPPVPENLTGLPIELTITAPDGSTRTETTEILTDIGQYEFNELSDFTLEGTYTLQTRFAGNELLTEAISGQKTVLVGESAGYAIIIQGRIENGEGLDSHNKTTNRIYQVLKERGFEDANIFYFNPNLDQQKIEIDGPPTVADFVTIEEMQNRINGSPAPFYLIMVDHGDRGGNFYINDVDLEYVTPDIWAWWLDELEAGLKDLSKPRIIMLGYCFSGKTLAAISKPGRIVISSATANEESFKGPSEPDGIRGGEYFMDELFKALGRGDSFRDAFNKAADKTNQYTDRGGNRFINIVNDFGDDSVQHPLIDIDGDGQGSHDAKLEQNTETNPSAPNSPYNLADMYLGAGADYDTNYAGNPADIRSVADTIYLSPEQTAANLSMTVNDVRTIKEAAVNVRLPSTELKPADTEHTGYAEQREIAELVEINLLCDFSQRCQRLTDEVAPDLFTEPGKYNLYYFVVDNETDNMSPVHRSVVYKTKANNGAPSPFELLAPEDMATTETALTFDWETSIEPEKEPITYTLVIAEDADFHNMVYQKSDIRASELAIEPSTVLLEGSEGLQPGTSYYWTVEAIDFFGARTIADEVRVFRTE